MTIRKLELSPYEEAEYQLREIENQIEKRIKGTLECFDIQITIGVSFDKHNFRMNIYIDDREYDISVQGRGGQIDKYLSPMLDIIKTEALLKKN